MTSWSANHTRRRLLLAYGLLMVALTSTGCSPRISVKKPLNSEAIQVAERGDRPALLVSVTTLLNGTEVSTSSDFRTRVLDKVRESRAFSEVSDTGTETDAIELRVTARETLDGHTAAAFWKGFLVGFTLFTLSPAIPFYLDYSLDISLEARWQRDQLRRYESRASGQMSMNYFQVFDQANRLKFVGDVSTSALNGVVNALVQDRPTMSNVDSSRTMADKADLTERLKSLRSLRDQGLISEQEFRQKRERLINDL